MTWQGQGKFSDDVETMVNSAIARGVAAPMLLFVAAHRPLAFAVGQLLHLAAPTASLLGLSGCSDWAALLSHPDGALILEQALGDVAEPDHD